ncbi:zinc-binding dehydrogenase [Amycolatopsis pigmentata]|uniref:Zinc-binding dehydrogenase n=1 Tax=Amycolatopsis pigmentata TaxID=450801 RepID=A0ABW5G3R5_9PSEU
MMWAYRVDGPGFVRRIERPDDRRELAPGQVRLRFMVAGLCGSDMPKLNGIVVRKGTPAHDGAPIHEVVGEVVESASATLPVGQRVVGTGGGVTGLCEFLVVPDQRLIPVPDALGDVEAVSIQSLGTVLRAADRLPDLSGKRVAVIGAGPIGLSFLHVLKQRGAAHLTSIDPVDREDTARRYGADEFVRMRSTQWVDTLQDHERPAVVVEAVGHQHASITDALRAVADHGFVYGFGSPDDPDYVLPYQQIYERGLTLHAGRTLGDWHGVLAGSRDYLLKHRDDFSDYVSHVIPASDAQTAYSLYARPQRGRLKVAIVAD